jgi:hypothetical protein
VAAGAGAGEATAAGIALLGMDSGAEALSSWCTRECSTAVAIVSVVGGGYFKVFLFVSVGRLRL